MRWYRCSFKILTKERQESGRTKHLPLHWEDVFAGSPDECVSELKKFFEGNPDVFDIREVRCRVLRTEWNPQQMAMYLQHLAAQIQKTEAGPMKKTESGILIPL